jgi:cyclopropane-fatty-acyl-phospholipid synthase
MSGRVGVARRAAFRALERLQGGTLVLRYPDGRGRTFGDGNGPVATLAVRDPGAFWEAVARRPRVALGEAYVDGVWDSDDLVALFTLLGRAVERTSHQPAVRALHRLQALRPDRAQRQSLDAAPGNLRAHYDLGNDLFALMLDPTMTYSCAYWERPDMTLEEAQLAKLRTVCRKLRLGPSDRVLEIGCGWGSLAIVAAREHGSRVTGLTLSPSQAQLARDRVREAGVEHLVEIREQDYRLVDETFTRVASIEMLEAIGHAELGTFCTTLDRLLEPGGAAVVQTIAVPDERYERYRRGTDWIREHVFPGALLPSVESIARALARTRLMITGLEEIGIGYAATLRAWRENVERHRARLGELGYDDRFVRLWTFYLAYCEAGFEIRALRDVQLVLTRPFDERQPRHPELRVTY